jgi:hypothetical protein
MSGRPDRLRRRVLGRVEACMRWWAAVPIAVGASVAGAVADLRVEGALRWLFAAALAVGCLVAVLAVSGPGLVATMVEPPVVAALAAGTGTVLTGHTPGGSAILLAVATRLTGAFFLVAGVTAGTVLIGVVRLARSRGRPVVPAR